MAISERQREQVLQELANGKSLRASCRAADVEYPMQFLREVESNETLALQYAHARQQGYQERADALLDTATDPSIDAQHKRIIVDTMKWELSKMLPKVFGDRLELAGKVTTGPEQLSDTELAAIIKQAK